MEAIILAVVSALASITVAIIGGIFGIRQLRVQKQVDEQTTRSEKQAEQRKKESLLSMEMAHANTKLTIGVAMALKRGHANGEIEEGLDAVKEASEKYDSYMRELANETLNK